jgi:ABC-2 type transport system ATP-binding protein
MLEVQQLSKGFGSQRVLSGIDFQVPAGEIFGLIGYNGVGKTTLLKILSGIYRPDRGSVRMDGVPVYEHPEIKHQCFFMTEEATFFAQSSMVQMQRFYSGYYPNWSRKTFQGLAAWFGVDPTQPISRFSKGMQRQASLTLALAARPRFLFLDEAFDGLDFTMRRQVRAMLRYYVREKHATAVISSHNLRELEGLADQIGMLSDGELVFHDTLARLRAHYQTARFQFDGPTEALSSLNAELLEREDDGYLCILQATPQAAAERLEALGCRAVRLQPVQLEEFFRTERKEKEVDFEEIFG